MKGANDRGGGGGWGATRRGQPVDVQNYLSEVFFLILTGCNRSYEQI